MTPAPTTEANTPRTKRTLSRQTLGEFRRFIVVGVMNTAVDLGVLNLLIAFSPAGRSGLRFMLFKTISFLVAACNSYLMNHHWTFGNHGREKGASAAGQFLAVSVLGAILNVGVASYVSSFVVPVRALEHYWPSVAALAGTGCGFLFNFFGYKHMVFSPRDPENP